MPTVLILGATSDIGFALARKYASEGYDVQLAGRNPEAMEPMRSDLEVRHRRRAAIYPFDALKTDTHRSFYESLSPRPDVAIYVAGYMNDNEKAAADWTESERTIGTNYTGAVSVLNIIAADFAARKAGTIIGISSVAGNRGRQSNYIYGSAKAGFTAYLSGLRNRMYHEGVHVLTVLPGFVYTRMTEHLKLPKPLTARPEEVAEAIYRGAKKRTNVLYVKWFWKWIMKIITNIPEPMFKKRKL